MTWVEKCDRASASGGRFTSKDKKDSESWNFCAMADRKEFINRTIYEEDLTEEAVNKAYEFTCAVKSNEVGEAENVYREIMGMETVLKCQK